MCSNIDDLNMPYSTQFEYSCKPIQFFVTRDRSKFLISLESPDREVQKYLFSFFEFCFVVEKNEFFPHSVRKSDKTMKNALVFSVFYWYGLANSQINSIFGISVKNYIEPHLFKNKIFSMKNRPLVGYGQKFTKNRPEGDHRYIFHRK